MRLLVDTHLLIWAVGKSSRLSQQALALLTNPDNDLLFSSASIWELAIKASRASKERSDLRIDPRVLEKGLRDRGYLELPVSSAHAVAVSDLPPIHKDPFDRILIAQAHVESITLLTVDATVARYPGNILKL